MALILDTNALSAFTDGDPALRHILLSEMHLAIPAIVLGEYLFGIRQSRFRARYEAWLQSHQGLFLILPVGAGTASCYAEIRSELKSSGNPIPTNDLWIAALARENDFSLVSRDRHFQAIRRLRLITW
ncbi:MAG: type II toxin-antitoxin system VapC family toxin [Bryobacteraceae bacterium]|jgi:tRNA(fMet)-specific endonuclease VapC